jgi:hypothetical protein
MRTDHGIRTSLNSSSTHNKGINVLPNWCTCGKLVTLANEHRCEDCFAFDAQRYSGKPSRVETIGHREVASHVCSPLSRRYDDGKTPAAT